MDAATQAWVDEKHKRTTSDLDENQRRAVREAIEAAQARGRDAQLAQTLEPQLALETGDERTGKALPTLVDKLLVPNFTTLDTRAGYWQDRRRQWLSLGLRGETTPERLKANGDYDGRRQGMIYGHDAPGGDAAFYYRKRAVENALGCELTTEEFKRDWYDRAAVKAGASSATATGTSVFDPVLCEVVYRWFSGERDHVLDPFAGGAVRGVVAGALGRSYSGVELRPEQIADNREQASRILGAESSFDFGRRRRMPRWYEGDATQLRAADIDRPADLVFTCPPYADLEVYSDDPRDLSTASYPAFRAMLATAMAQSVERLRDNRFAVWTVGEARAGASGCSYGLVADTVRAARDAGLGLYNEAILLNSVGSAALRAQRIMRSRKLVRVHQHVFVFVKGDWSKAAEHCGDVELEL